MKSDKITWSEYLSDYYSSEIINKEYQNAFIEVERIRKLYEGWLNIEMGDLRYKNVPKILIRQKNQSFIIEQGHPNYAFRFQCLTSGRQSKIIPTKELQFYGVSKKDQTDGGNYTEKQDIKNKTVFYVSNYYSLVDKIFQKYKNCREQLTRQMKYNEYLCSDEWQFIRQKCFAFYNKECVLTGAKENLHVHHLHYRNVGNENLEDLVLLRADVHEKLHQGNEQVIKELEYIIDKYNLITT
jgi:hypothetical protein